MIFYIIGINYMCRYLKCMNDYVCDFELTTALVHFES